jgi:class 3 adenylate cyclase
MQHSGAVVKTIGDAVMAVFSRPADAVSAALHILTGDRAASTRAWRPRIILKIGAHCGPSIAVTLNDNLDYFGQTVNVAARVQALADAGEICITERCSTSAGRRRSPRRP